MIVRCPGCTTRFTIADTAIGDGGAARRVRCSHCGHLWQHTAEAESVELIEPMLPDVAPRPAPDTEKAEPLLFAQQTGGAEAAPEPTKPGDKPVFLPTPVPLSRPSTTSEPPAAGHWRTARVAALGLGLAAALVLVAILGRATIEGWFPATAPIYAMLPLGDAPGTGLKVSVIPMRSADSLVINGDIVNGATIARSVPRLRVTLLDGNKSDLDSKVIDPPVAQLRPGGTAHFNAIFLHPTTAAVRVDVTFAHD